jgi:imidazolonepropionase-like amidohydrolase
MSRSKYSSFLFAALLAAHFGFTPIARAQNASARNVPNGTTATLQTAIRAGHLIDPASGMVSENVVILIENGKIVDVGPNLSTANVAQIINLSDSWVMPGLMDGHTHITSESRIHPGLDEDEAPDTGVPYLYESTSFRTARGIYHAKLLLDAGFTTIRDLGNEAEYAMTAVTQAMDQGWFSGPTMYHAGKIIAPYGGQANTQPPERGSVWSLEYLDADAPDDIKRAIRKNIYYGANIIKLVTGDKSYYYSQEEIQLAADEAHRAGLTLAVHVISDGPAARNAILGGSDSIEHGLFLENESLTLMKERGTVLVATEFPWEHNAIYYGGKEALAKEDELGIIDRLQRANEIGVTLAFGSDVYYLYPGQTLTESVFDFVDIWAEAGIPPAEILKAMTTNIAALLGIQDERGSISAGHFADIVAMPSNPLNDVSKLQHINFVMKEGTVIRHE